MDIVARDGRERVAYSVRETAELLGLSEASLFRALRRGDIESVMLGGRRLIPARSLETLLAPKAGRQVAP